jgi:dCMP deaminase
MRGAITALREELKKADCSRRKVAAVVMLGDHHIIGRGHNSLPVGSCLDGQCPRGKLTYDEQPKDVGYAESGCTSVHAEVAALANAGFEARGSVMYVTEIPCSACERYIIQCGVREVRILHPDRIGQFIAPV